MRVNSRSNGRLVASAEPNGTVTIVEGYENGERNGDGHNGHRQTCDDRRRPHTSRVLAEVVDVRGRRNARVIQVLSTPPDGVSTSPTVGDVMNILPNSLYPLDNDQKPWGTGSVVAVDCQMNSSEDWEQKGYSAYVVTSIHVWCCMLKTMAKRVAPLSAAEKAAVQAAARVVVLGDRFKVAVADVAEYGVGVDKIAADSAASAAYADFRTALASGNEREAVIALERFQAAIAKLIPTGISVMAMAELAAELPDDLASFHAST